MYEPRLYRDGLNRDRFRYFAAGYLETDLWLGVDKNSYDDTMPTFVSDMVKRLRKQLNGYIERHPAFQSSMEPISATKTPPLVARRMIEAAREAGAGPMAAVAGAFSWYAATGLQRNYALNEIVVENGGDLYLDIQEPVNIAIHAGQSPLSGKLGLDVQPGESPLGVCTSSGTVGHSISYGKADAVMIACSDALLADAHATAWANRVQSADDIKPLLDEMATVPDIRAAAIIVDGKVGMSGRMEFRPL
jgi:uncharacterized protein